VGSSVDSGVHVAKKDTSRAHEASGIGLAALLVTTLAFLTPPTLFEGLDWGELHLPNRRFLAQSLGSGRLPLWNPYVALGRPFLADVETAVFYPPNLIYVVLDPSVALALLTAAHVVLAGAGMLRLGRLLGAERWASAIAALSFVLGAPIAARLAAGQVAYAHAACYLPLIFALGAEMQHSFSWARLARLAAALGLQLLCGHPQIAWVTWLGLVAFLAGRAGSRPIAWRSWLEGAGGLAAAFALGLGLAGIMLGPFLELVTQGNRAQPTLAFAAGGAMEWSHWISLFLPNGNTKLFYWESNQYMGLLAAAVGLAGLLRGRDANARGLAAVASVGALVAAGPRTPVFGVLYSVLPGIALFRIHARAAILVSFALTVGGALFLSHPPQGPRRKQLLAVSLAIPVLAVGLAWFWRPLPIPRSLLLGRLALIVAVAILGFLAVSEEHPLRRASLLGLPMVVVADLLTAQLATKTAWLWPVPPTSGTEKRLASRLAEAGLLRPGLAPPRIAVPRIAARENAAMAYGWASVAGYNALTLDRVWRYLHLTLGVEPSVDKNTYVSARVYEHGPFPYREAALVAGWDPKTSAIALRPTSDPRAYVVGKVRPVRDWHEALTFLRGGHDVHREALVEARDLAATGSLRPETIVRGRATILSFEPERIVIGAETSEPALLVLKEAWYPGWRAWVDGRPAPCVAANAWMRAVPLPAGTHDVRLEYRSRFLGAGAATSVVSAALLLLGPRLLRPRPLLGDLQSGTGQGRDGSA